MRVQKLTNTTYFFLSILFVLQSCGKTQSKTISPEIKKDSIALWIKASKNKSYSVEQQKRFLYKAYIKTISESKKSIKTKNLSTIAYRFHQLKDTLKFQKINKKALHQAKKDKDSFFIGDVHWNYASHYFKNEIYHKAYYHYNISYQYFNGIHKEYEAARMLYSMSFIKGRYRDYTGSEVLIMEAIKKFKNLKNYRYLYNSYNHLGLLQNDIHEYDKAIFYHQKALGYIPKIKKKGNYYAWSVSNIGLTYLEQGKYLEAIKYLNIALKNNNNDINSYAKIIDNRAYCKLMLNDTIHIKKDFLESLYIRDSLNDKAGILINKIRLSKYYGYAQDTSKAYQYAKEANTLAKEINNGVDYLESLNLLSILDPKKAKQYLDRYIQFNDSLLTVERKVQNKFTRIAFETDEYIEETERLSEQKFWILGSGIGFIFILSLGYFLRVQKAKNEKLLLETEQQKANEEVYLLTLQQQTVLEQEKAEERNRISEELHDGILGRLFGTRLGLGFLDLTADKTTLEQRQSFLDELQDIEKEIRDVSHQLNNDFNSSEIGFTNIVNQLLKDKSVLGHFEFQLKIDKLVSWEKINEISKVNIYRIVQESLQNIVKHANAENVLISFSIENEFLLLEIKDDGKGFDSKKSKKGIGMKNIKSRVQKLKGTLKIISKKKEGTSLDIRIPII